MAIKKLMMDRHSMLALLILVLAANLLLYYTSFGTAILNENSRGIVIGSMIDLAVVSPLLFIIWKKQWSIKNIVLAIASGLIFARFLIPIEYLEPYVAVTWIGFAIEGAIVLFELYLLFLMFKHIPAAVRYVKSNSLPVIFSFSEWIESQVSSKVIIKIICTELLMFYYAFGCWRKRVNEREDTFTLHKNSSLIALYIMAIHSILIETLALHWWLYSKFPILSMILLVLNLYSIVFLIGNMQAIRHNPAHISQGKLYLSFGLIKRIQVDLDNISEIIDEPTLLQHKLTKDTIEFIARDLEDVSPHMILALKTPVTAEFMIGIKKEYRFIAIRADESTQLKAKLKQKQLIN